MMLSLRRATTNLRDILLRDGTRPLAFIVALRVLAWGALLGLSTGPRAAVLLVFGLPIAVWSVVFSVVAILSFVGLGLGWRRLRWYMTLLTLVLWGLATIATMATNPVGALIFYVPDYASVFMVLWRVRPVRGPRE